MDIIKEKKKELLLKSLPKIDRILETEWGKNALDKNARVYVLEAARETVEFFRKKILNEEIDLLTEEEIFKMFNKYLQEKGKLKLKPVINGTGVILHTNLGRSLLSEKAANRVREITLRYCNLEYSLHDGKRGSRHFIIEEVLKKITGAEAAMVVNNNAAAILLVLSTLCKGKESIVSRGHLVEIGGSFRIPEVMALSGSTLIEVGTTNRTHLYDYENAIKENTGALVKVHQSNFKVLGFTEEVALEELVSLGHKFHVPVIEDIGSGSLIDFSRYGLSYEPTIQESIKKGADIVTFSSDKMLGGPQAGVIVGKKEYIDQMKKNQLTRALRVCKMTLAALEVTLESYIEEDKAVKNIPTLQMITSSKEEQKKRALELKERVKGLNKGFEFYIEEDISSIGGGAMPLEKIPTYVLKMKSSLYSPEVLEKKMRENDIPIIVRVCKEGIIFDLRTIQDCDFEIIEDCIKGI